MYTSRQIHLLVNTLAVATLVCTIGTQCLEVPCVRLEPLPHLVHLVRIVFFDYEILRSHNRKTPSHGYPF